MYAPGSLVHDIVNESTGMAYIEAKIRSMYQLRNKRGLKLHIMRMHVQKEMDIPKPLPVTHVTSEEVIANSDDDLNTEESETTEEERLLA